MTILISQFFFPKNKIRQNEIMKCLNNNGRNQHIDKIVHLNEIKYRITDKKLEQVIIGKRLTFNDAVLYANEHLQGETVIVSNADIYFDDSLQNINKLNLDDKTIVCNLRWENKNKLFCKNGEPRSDSQDFWIFKSPLNINFPYQIPFGQPGCDKAIVALCQQNGYNTINVPYLIKGIHLQSVTNKYFKDINLPRKMLSPSKTKVYIDERYSQEEKDDIIKGFDKNTFVLVNNVDKAHCVYQPEVSIDNEEEKEEVSQEELNNKIQVVINTECVDLEETEEVKETSQQNEETEIKKAEYLDSIIDSIVNENQLENSSEDSEEEVKEI